MVLTTKSGKLLVSQSGALALSCDCCGPPPSKCASFCCSRYTFGVYNCLEDGQFARLVTIPLGYVLPVPVNITGIVNDDLLIDGQSITLDLGLDPGPYPTTINPDPNCVGAHVIGQEEGPYKDIVSGGITFPIAQRQFSLSVRDSVGFGVSIDITICIDPYGTQPNRGPPTLTGECVDPDGISGFDCIPNPFP